MSFLFVREEEEEDARLFLTFDVNVFQENRLHHFGPHQDSAGPPVQNVVAGFQVHLEHARFCEMNGNLLFFLPISLSYVV